MGLLQAMGDDENEAPPALSDSLRRESMDAAAEIIEEVPAWPDLSSFP